MKTAATLEHCRAYFDSQLNPNRKGAFHRPGPTVTLSRPTGSGGVAIAESLARYLQQHRPGPDASWTVFSRSLVEKVLAEHHLPTRMAEYMPEDRVSYIQDTVEELLGLHPSRTALVTQVTETILGLAELGNCIIVGRGAHVILARNKTAFHVRLVCPLETRVERVAAREGLTREEAREFVRREDNARSRYLKTHFQSEISDPLGYHLVLNTEWFTEEEAAELIGQAVIRHFPEK